MRPPEAVDAAAAAPAEPPVDPSGTKDRWWRESSFDLRRGLDVLEKETIPGELLDDLPDPQP